MCIRDRAYPDKRYPFTRKLPQLLFAGTFRKGELKEYNGWILLEINRLKSIEEALSLKHKIVEYPQTLFAMIGSSGRSVKFVVAYTYPDGSLPRSCTDAEVFHAHAYRHALKTYEPRLSYPIELKRPVLEMGCRPVSYTHLLHPMRHLFLTDRLESELSVDGDCVRRGVNRHF